MSTPVLPLVIRGPGAVIFNSFAFYFKGDLTIKLSRPSFEVDGDFFGRISTRGQGSAMVDIEFPPVGQIKSLIKYYPYGPTNLVATSPVGSSIFTGSNVPVVIHTKAGVTTTYARAGISKMPTLMLSPRKTAFGPMTISAINKSVDPTDAAALKTIAAASFTDASFDAASMATDIYTAALGERETPFDAMGAREGFELEPTLTIEDAQDDNVGIADRHIVAVQWKCRFAPNNLTEAQVDELCQWQDADAILAGQSVARGPGGTPEDLVIDADFLTATLHACGVVSAEHGMGVKKDRNGQIEFVNDQTFTAGVPDPLVSLVVN